MLIWCVFHGRFGNNLFQYAAARAAASRAKHATLLMDFSRLPAGRSASEIAELDLVRLGLPGLILPSFINRLSQKMFRRMACELCLLPVVTDADIAVVSSGLGSSSLLSGYFQDVSILKGQEEAFRTMVRDRLDGIFGRTQRRCATSVAVHVRRGDYLNEPLRQVCDHRYFSEAISEFRAKLPSPIFFVFSDDPSWCSEHLTGRDIEIVRPGRKPDSLLDFAQMTSCDHQIISNSSFSWWAGWLNPNPGKLVIGPDVWLRDLADSLAGKEFPGFMPLSRFRSGDWPDFQK